MHTLLTLMIRILLSQTGDMPDEVSLMVTTEGLMALADMALASKSQSRLEELLAKNVEGTLSAEETKELDLLITQVPFRRKQHSENPLAVRKARTRQARAGKSKTPKTLGISNTADFSDLSIARENLSIREPAGSL